MDFKFLLTSGSLSIVLVASNGLINFFTRRVLAQGLPDTELGFFFSIFAFYSVFIAILDLGLTQSSTILIAKYEAEKNHSTAQKVYSNFFLIRLVILFFATAFFMILSPIISSNYFHNEEGNSALLILSIWFASNLVMGSIFAVFDALKKTIGRNLLLFLNYSGVLIGVNVLMIFGSLDVESVAFVYAVAYIVPLVVFMVYVWRWLDFPLALPTGESISLFTESAKLGKWVALSSAGITVIFSLDTVLMTQVSDYTSIALYNIAASIMQILLGFFMLIPQLATPLVLKYWFTDNKDLAFRTYYIFIGLTLVSLFFIVPLSLFFLPSLIPLLFGVDFLAAKNPAVILLTGVPLYAMVQLSFLFLNILGNQKLVAGIVMACVLFDAVLIIVLEMFYGVNGVAFATTITYGLMLTISIITIASIKKLNVNLLKSNP